MYLNGHMKRFIFVMDLFIIAFGGKKWRSYVLTVPLYCRFNCDLVKECRKYENNWKTEKGCIILNS